MATGISNKFTSEEETMKLKTPILDNYSELLKEEVLIVISQKGDLQKDFDNMLNGDD